MDDCACIMAEAVHFRRPLPIRGAWIEIISEAMFGAADAGRFPFEERGLKSRACERPPQAANSRSSSGWRGFSGPDTHSVSQGERETLKTTSDERWCVL